MSEFTTPLERQIEEGRARFRHNLMTYVWSAKGWHQSGKIPPDGWEDLKKQFELYSTTTARPETFTEEFGIQTKVAMFITHELGSDWSDMRAIMKLDSEGNDIDDFMITSQLT